MITTQFLEQQYRSIARKYRIQIREVTPTEMSLVSGSPSLGCVCSSKINERYFPPPVHAEVLRKYRMGKNTCILINKNQPNYDKASTLFHEEGHVNCHQSNCFCMKRKIRSYQELHAYIFSLRKLIVIGAFRSLMSELHTLNYYGSGNGPYKDKEYAVAALMLTKTKFWKKEVLEYINNAKV